MFVQKIVCRIKYDNANRTRTWISSAASIGEKIDQAQLNSSLLVLLGWCALTKAFIRQTPKPEEMRVQFVTHVALRATLLPPTSSFRLKQGRHGHGLEE